MKLFMGSGRDIIRYGDNKCKYVLESFYYMPKTAKCLTDKGYNFMLDSGAFTMLNSRKNVDIDLYVDKYINFINEYDVKLFFEMDIDSIIGYERVKELRYKINRRTKKRCIPVWHKSRGIAEFRKLVKTHDYIALGGIVTKEITPSEHFLLNAFCDYAHEHGCKIHGLGFTPSKSLHKYRFDSVDSVSWLVGGNYGTKYIHDGDILRTVQTKENWLTLRKHNYQEWLKYQKMLDAR